MADDFTTSMLYSAICEGRTSDVLNLLQTGSENALQLSTSGETFLHLAIRRQHCDAQVVEALVGATRLGQRDEDGKTAVDRAREEGTLGILLPAVSVHLAKLTAAVDHEKLQELVMDGWMHWPEDEMKRTLNSGLPEAAQYTRGRLSIPVSISININRHITDKHYCIVSVPLTAFLYVVSQCLW